jgi:hypothetical protein
VSLAAEAGLVLWVKCCHQQPELLWTGDSRSDRSRRQGAKHSLRLQARFQCSIERARVVWEQSRVVEKAAARSATLERVKVGYCGLGYITA